MTDPHMHHTKQESATTDWKSRAEAAEVERDKYRGWNTENRRLLELTRQDVLRLTSDLDLIRAEAAGLREALEKVEFQDARCLWCLGDQYLAAPNGPHEPGCIRQLALTASPLAALAADVLAKAEAYVILWKHYMECAPKEVVGIEARLEIVEQELVGAVDALRRALEGK